MDPELRVYGTANVRVVSPFRTTFVLLPTTNGSIAVESEHSKLIPRICPWSAVFVVI